MAGNRVAAATLKATVADLLGTPKIDGNFDVKGVTSPAASVASLSGTAHSDGSATAFDVRAGGIAAPQLTAAGLTGFDLTASGRLADRTVTLASARLMAAIFTGALPLSAEGLARARATLRSRTRALELFWPDLSWDLFMLVLTETDRIFHFFYPAVEDLGHPLHSAFLEFLEE